MVAPPKVGSNSVVKKVVSGPVKIDAAGPPATAARTPPCVKAPKLVPTGTPGGNKLGGAGNPHTAESGSPAVLSGSSPRAVIIELLTGLSVVCP